MNPKKTNGKFKSRSRVQRRLDSMVVCDISCDETGSFCRHGIPHSPMCNCQRARRCEFAGRVSRCISTDNIAVSGGLPATGKTYTGLAGSQEDGR